MKLIIGNKNYSSWSLRPWLAMSATGIPFEEEMILLDTPETKAQIAQYSGAGTVPILVSGDIVIWETLAILEYLAENFPQSKLWPEDPAARAFARSISNEMHAGFGALRSELPMNLWRPVEARALSDKAQQNVARICAIWKQARQQFGAGGPFLFGAFSNADAMFAPVATRFRTYDVAIDAESAAYVEAIHALPAFRQWHEAALKETEIVPHDEIDWPVVKRV